MRSIMSRPKDDKSGQRFGYLTVLERVPDINGETAWLCQCICGNTKVVKRRNLTRGYTKSCGCRAFESKKTHGMRGTRLYGIWSRMKRRCLNPKDDHYRNYGARGIGICIEWLAFEPFKDWALSNGYEENLTIDRIDVNGNYCPENCRWVDIKTQENNKRNNHLIEYDGQTHNLTEWAELIGIERHVLYQRLRKGWSIEKALSTPLLKTWSRTKNGNTNDKRNSASVEKEVS